MRSQLQRVNDMRAANSLPPQLHAAAKSPATLRSAARPSPIYDRVPPLGGGGGNVGIYASFSAGGAHPTAVASNGRSHHYGAFKPIEASAPPAGAQTNAMLVGALPRGGARARSSSDVSVDAPQTVVEQRLAALPRGVANLARRAHFLRREITSAAGGPGASASRLENIEFLVRARRNMVNQAETHRELARDAQQQIQTIKRDRTLGSRTKNSSRTALRELRGNAKFDLAQARRLDSQLVSLDRVITSRGARIGRLNALRARLDGMIRGKGFNPATLEPRTRGAPDQ